MYYKDKSTIILENYPSSEKIGLKKREEDAKIQFNAAFFHPSHLWLLRDQRWSLEICDNYQVNDSFLDSKKLSLVSW